MNKNSLVRKIFYIVAIVGLLLPLFALGRPGTGMIGHLRSKYKMGQANLGKLDPTSESMRLATLGMKGIASTILWLRADWYKEEKYFDRFSATLNQISLLQPHFLSVWEFQAHNMGYNVAPEFEDYRQRYEWIKKGIDYLIKGTKFNERKPMLQYILGQQYFGSKFGKADEKVQYRSLFRNDTDFHDYLKDQGLVGIDTGARGYDQKPDNWLTGKLWLNQATDLYEAGAAIKKSPHLLYSYSPAWRMYYAEAIESEGILDASAALAWKQGGDEWAQFGTKSLYQLGQGKDLTLLSQAAVRNEITELEAKMNVISADAKKQAVDMLRKSVSPEELAIYDRPLSELSESDYAVYNSVATRLIPSPQQIASQLPQSKQVETLSVTTKVAELTEFLRLIDSYRSQVNYDYWEMRARVEQRDEMIKARRLTFEADKMIDEANVKSALELYDEAWVYWDWLFRRFPVLMTEEIGDDVQKSVGRYRKLLEEDPDESFVLTDFMRFRRFHNNDYSANDAGLIMDQWQKLAPTLSDEPPVYPPIKKETPPKPSTEQASPAPIPQPSPAAPTTSQSTRVAPAPEPAKSEPPTQAAAPAEKETTRPPTLENPDFQN
ncbi:MAG: hypothetical protein ABL921_23910 [Pirellula sp.]